MKLCLGSFFIFLSLFSFAQKDSVLVKEAAFRYKCQDAILEKTEENFLVHKGYSGYYRVNYEAIATESVLIKSWTTKCIIEEPVYRTIQVAEERYGKIFTYEKQILVSPAKAYIKEIPTEYKVFSKLAERSREKSDTLVTVPDQYITYEVWREVKKATIKRIEVPAEYQPIPSEAVSCKILGKQKGLVNYKIYTHPFDKQDSLIHPNITMLFEEYGCSKSFIKTDFYKHQLKCRDRKALKLTPYHEVPDSSLFFDVFQNIDYFMINGESRKPHKRFIYGKRCDGYRLVFDYKGFEWNVNIIEYKGIVLRVIMNRTTKNQEIQSFISLNRMVFEAVYCDF